MEMDLLEETTTPSLTLPEIDPGKEEAGDLGQRPRKLPAVLRTRDLVVFMVLIVLFISNTSGVQFAGPAALVYWVLGALTFLVPCVIITRWLARRFPEQSVPYVWITKVMGSKWGFISAFCIWLPGMLATVAVIDNGLVFIQYLLPNWFTNPWQQCLGIVVLLGIATGVACLTLRWLKRILLVLTALYVSVFALIGGLGVWWLESGHPAATALNVATSWQPNWQSFAAYSIIVLALLGVNIPMFASNELRNGVVGVKRASRYVWWGGAIAFLAYMTGTFGIMVMVPSGHAGDMTASMQAVQMILGPAAGNSVAVILIFSEIATTIAYLLLFARVMIFVAQDRRLPSDLKNVNRYGVPIRSILVQAGIVALATILLFVGVPSLFGAVVSVADFATEIYDVMQAGATVVWLISVIQIFALVVWLLNRRKQPLIVSLRTRLFLSGVAIIGSSASVIGVWATISSSWIPGMIPNGRWAVLIGSVIAFSFCVGLLASELPRLRAMLKEQQKATVREIALRKQLESSYEEQQILVEQQQELLAEVDRLYREQSQAAITDAVTGLPNHRAVMSRVEEEVSRCQRSQGSCAILFIDLDHFKQVNDTWGHRAGDVVLREIGARLHSTLRLEDFVGRYGGEEFAIALTNVDLNGAIQTAERLRAVIANEPCMWITEETQNVASISITGSIGLALFGLHGTSREELVEQADQAMYQAKHSGRNRVCIANVELSLTQERTLPIDKLPVDDHKKEQELATVQVLSAVASAHDIAINAHAQRMAQLAVAVAIKLRLPKEEMNLVRLSALFHDIGKIGVPDTILHKPGPLTNEEWTVMRRHPEIGQFILEQAGGVFHRLADVVVAHHERWDGNGYPNKLVGEGIPVCARIVTVVDTYDAMTSHRPYRQALSDEVAKTELQRCAGSQFDPRIVEAFLTVLEEQAVTSNQGSEDAKIYSSTLS